MMLLSSISIECYLEDDYFCVHYEVLKSIELREYILADLAI
jgi:hypothetical protein